MKVLVVAPSLRNTSPGSRFRIEQWMRWMERDGVEFAYSGFDDEDLHAVIYQPGHYFAKAYHMLRAVGRRLALVPHLRQYDAVFLYEEASRIGPAIIERIIRWLRVPLVYDFCDPIYIAGRSPTNSFFSYLKCAGKTATICRVASHVIVGNPDLAEFAGQYNTRVDVVPITIDTEDYKPRRWDVAPAQQPVIGWSGSHTTMPHLDLLRNVLQTLRRTHNFRLHVMGAPRYELPGVEVRAEPWRADAELAFLQSCDIGIMPLPGDNWTRLRSHLKARQYMGAAVPCVASPVGVIRELIQDGVNGFLAATEDEWVQKLSALLGDVNLRRHLGVAGRETIETRYSGEMWARRVLAILQSVVPQRSAARAQAVGREA
ncbi:MAG: glycosyltransferase family 4 protein [Terriglobales bacterium]